MAHQFELVAASVLAEFFKYFLKGFTLFADPFFKIVLEVHLNSTNHPIK